MLILDENIAPNRVLGRKQRVFSNAFFGRGQIFVILTKETDETGSLDENLNRMFTRSVQTVEPVTAGTDCPASGAANPECFFFLGC